METIPTYALIDILRCAGSAKELREAFAGKTVLIGSTLPEEDRHLAPSRFISPPAAPATATDVATGCRLGHLGASDPGSATVPGVFLHAAATIIALR